MFPNLKPLLRGFTSSAVWREQQLFSNAQKQAPFALASLRSFPSLEPHSIFPVHNVVVNSPLRRDVLWLAVVMELDNRRVGAASPPGRSQHKFSRRKLFKQKGTGRARVGDANSPIRYRGAQALARQAPNDYSTDLPRKVYDLAYRSAISDAFRKNRLFIVGNDAQETPEKILQGDSFDLEICTGESTAINKFVKTHDFEKRSLLFVVDDYFKVPNLRKATLRYPSSKVIVKQKDEVEVRDILKSQRIFIEKNAFDFIVNKVTKYANF